MKTCKLCGAVTDMPCGALDAEVCPACWLAADCDDDICRAAENLEDVEFFVSSKRVNLEMSIALKNGTAYEYAVKFFDEAG